MNWQDDFIRALLAAPEYVNPTIALAAAAQRAELSGDADFINRAAQSGAVERAVREGQREAEAVARTLGMLGRATPAASKTVPVGF